MNRKILSISQLHAERVTSLREMFSVSVLLSVTITLMLFYILHPINGLCSRTTWVSRNQKGKTSVDLSKARNDVVLGWQWHKLDHILTICTSLQTDNHTNTSSLNFYGPDALSSSCPMNTKASERI